ncbi:unnamed protein product [Polarella glacialis]|uniref:Uncharacterized protein n=1 Tax=Polarella glacialis TaxID=89957 RepID=A0A813LLZ0_POLGL|nr:unnamed protein product [Polarella glacialis]
MARSNFHAAVFPGLSAARGWSLEAFADALVSTTRATSGKKRLRGGEEAADSLQVLYRALRAYAESERILGIMFGAKHEFPEAIREKKSVAEKMVFVKLGVA